MRLLQDQANGDLPNVDLVDKQFAALGLEFGDDKAVQDALQLHFSQNPPALRWCNSALRAISRANHSAESMRITAWLVAASAMPVEQVEHGLEKRFREDGDLRYLAERAWDLLEARHAS